MKTRIKCPSCYFKYEEEIDFTKSENFCVCPRCGTSFTYIKPEEKEEEKAEEVPIEKEQETNQKDETPIEEDIQKGLRVCSQCGTSYKDTMFICPTCGAPADGFYFCPECHSLVSTYAHSCPTCGCPLEAAKVMVTCPDCGFSYDIDKHVCPSCGCPAPGYIYCEECNTLISDKMMACPNCGCPVSLQQSQPTPSRTAEPETELQTPEESVPVYIQPLSIEPPQTTIDSKVEEKSSKKDTSKEIDLGKEGNTEQIESESDEDLIVDKQTETDTEDRPVTTSQIEKKPSEWQDIPEETHLQSTEDGEEQDITNNNKRQLKIIAFCIFGFVVIIIGCLFLGRTLSHRSSTENESVVVNDSIATKNGTLPKWLIGDWYGKFTSERLGNFEVSIKISVQDSLANFYVTTYDKGEKNLEKGNIVAFNENAFDVLFEKDQSPVTFPIDAINKKFGLSKNMWLDKKSI